ncbi:MAG: hypothetical protein IPK75_20180 [Acidobacteria bacterium]|nr:hypothetical protein [Acidobacteriota bacterium]
MIAAMHVAYLTGWAACLCLSPASTLANDMRRAGILTLWPIVMVARVVEIMAEYLANNEVRK